MNKEGSHYGDQSFISNENMMEQVKLKRSQGYDDKWDGCMRSGKCCSYFNISAIGQKYYENLEKDDLELWLAHHDVKSKEELPDLHLGYNHICSHLRAKRDSDGNTVTKCNIYNNRPKTCDKFTCNASKVRAGMMKELIAKEQND